MSNRNFNLLRRIEMQNNRKKVKKCVRVREKERTNEKGGKSDRNNGKRENLLYYINTSNIHFD